MKLRKFSSLLLALLTVFSLAMPAFAADSSVIYEGGAEKFVFLDDDDLFDNFKGVMPGDTLTQKVTIRNNFSGCDYVDIYMRAEAHDSGNTPVNPEHSKAFLEQLNMTVKQGSKTLFNASPDKEAGLKNNILLGSFRYRETEELTVELEVPITLGNEFANALGEVDWVFLVEERNDPEEAEIVLKARKLLNGADPKNNKFTFILRDKNGRILQRVKNDGKDIEFDPLTFDEAGTYTYTIEEREGTRSKMTYDDTVYTVKIKVTLDGDYEAEVTYLKKGKEVDGTPTFRNYLKSDGPKTGDDTVIWPYALAFGASICGIFVLLMSRRRKKESK